MAFYGQLSGNIGRDPELKYLDNGRCVANFTMAVRQNKRNGENPPARWVKVAVWGKAAEYVGNYVKRGDKVVCFGRVEPPELFTRRDGSQGLAEVFTAENIEKWGEQGAAPPSAAPVASPVTHPAYAAAGHQPAASATALPVWQSQANSDDIPF